MATMVRSTLGLDSATIPTNDQMKALVGKTLKTSGGKTFVFYDKGDGSVGYTEAE